MNFLKKIFKSSEDTKNEELKKQPVSLSLDDSFVHNFIERGGKFLYCLKKDDVTANIINILEENDWNTLTCKDTNILKYLSTSKVKTYRKLDGNNPIFTSCEFLISENGSILFSSNQIEDKRLSTLTNDFIVFATTSQIVKNMGESLTGIKVKYSNNLPTNISPVKNYGINYSDDNFLNYGSNNSKNLYLLLLEDL
ncbi:LUD domain-containing protein [Urechidicola croceus]|uniref:LUD domain-containing protein n=1 Tax=Urechidicola croceus TaxID=1850246 RepID=A0A1D8PBB5_9FLAO|nr:LUD domain-containing protein [Urechidicola croceus]AOW21875.1 hypothetical protein LPB138_14800 [Urechidicola croceus]